MLALPVIANADPRQFLRLYRRSLALWSSHVADEMAFGPAAAYLAPRLATIPEANCLLGELDPADAPDLARYFQDAHTTPRAWYLPPESPAAMPDCVSELKPRGVLLHRLLAKAVLPMTHADLTILPARASFRHVTEIASLLYPGSDPAQAAEAAVAHLDDPHVDALLALRQGLAVGYTAVLSVGDAGFIMDLFIHPEHRHRGYARALAGQLLDLCHRSVFQHVLCARREEDAPANRFLQHLGFTPVATTILRANNKEPMTNDQ